MTGTDPSPPVCILAGGRATRLGEAAATVPKALVEVAGQPFILHQLRALADHGLTDVVICAGHLGDRIEDRLGSAWSGVTLRYSHDGPGLDGTLGAIRRAAPLLGDRFLVLYGDTWLRVDYARFCAGWAGSGLPAGMTVIRNDGRWDRSNARYGHGRVDRYDKARPDASMRWIDYGLGALTRSALDAVDRAETDLAALYRALAGAGRLYGYEVHDRFYEIGTPAALAETDAFLRSCPGPSRP